MSLKTKYITPEDFKQYFGIDLDVELKNDDNQSNKAVAFLTRIENRLETFVNSTFHRNVELEFKHFTSYQKEHYKLALLEQAYYILRNGDISSDSGYDPDEGIKATRQQLKELSISENAKQELILCGLWCRKIRSTGRVGGVNDWWY